jgi:hypothetical protein
MSAQKHADSPRCWRAYVCAACRCRYRCLIRAAPSEPDDENPAPNDPTKSLTAEAAWAQPCPNCGAVPGVNVDNPTAAQHGRLAILITLAIGGVAASVMFSPTLGYYWSSAAFGALALLSAVGHTFIIVRHRRRFRRAHQAKRPPADERVRIVDAGATVPSGPRWARVGTIVCLAAGFAAVLLCLLPILLVETLGWPRLKSATPEVASPGDKVVLMMTGPVVPFRAYKVVGLKATVANAADLGGPKELPVEALITTGSFSEQKDKGYQIQLPVRIELPDEPRWGGETVRVGMHLSLENTEKQDNIRYSYWIPIDVPVASEGSGPMYQASWRLALYTGALPTAFLGLLLAWLAGSARPKRPAEPPAPGPVVDAPKPTA